MPIFLHKYQPRAVLQVTGLDAGDYLQSQFSADLAPSTEPLATYGLWLSRKGKVDGDGFVLRNSEHDFLVISYHCPSESLAEKIVANVIADDVEIEDLTLQYAGISVWGEKASEVIKAIELDTPTTSSWTANERVKIFAGRRSRDSGFELVGPVEDIDPLLHALRSQVDERGGRELNENEVHLSRIEARIPAIPDELGPNDLPQEGFLEKDAVSFDKGCFLGQEVMARLRSLGGVQRRLWVVEPHKTGLSTPSEIFIGDKPMGFLKTRYPKGNKEIGVAMVKTKYVQMDQSYCISTEPNEKPSISMLHEFIF